MTFHNTFMWSQELKSLPNSWTRSFPCDSRITFTYPWQVETQVPQSQKLNWIPNPQETKSLSITSASTSEYIRVPSPRIIQICEERMGTWTQLRFLHEFLCVKLTFFTCNKRSVYYNLDICSLLNLPIFAFGLCTDVCWIDLKDTISAWQPAYIAYISYSTSLVFNYFWLTVKDSHYYWISNKSRQSRC